MAIKTVGPSGLFTHCRTRTQVLTRIWIPHSMAPLYCAEHVHIAQNDSDLCLDSFLVQISVPELKSDSVSGKVDKPQNAVGHSD